MAKNEIKVRISTKYDFDFPFTLVRCAKGILGGIYFLEKEDMSGFAYHIQMQNGYWYIDTFETELDAIKYLVQNSFLMNWGYKMIKLTLWGYENSESGAITYRDNIENINLAIA